MLERNRSLRFPPQCRHEHRGEGPPGRETCRGFRIRRRPRGGPGLAGRVPGTSPRASLFRHSRHRLPLHVQPDGEAGRRSQGGRAGGRSTGCRCSKAPQHRHTREQWPSARIGHGGRHIHRDRPWLGSMGLQDPEPPRRLRNREPRRRDRRVPGKDATDRKVRPLLNPHRAWLGLTGPSTDQPAASRPSGGQS